MSFRTIDAEVNKHLCADVHSLSAARSRAVFRVVGIGTGGFKRFQYPLCSPALSEALICSFCNHYVLILIWRLVGYNSIVLGRGLPQDFWIKPQSFSGLYFRARPFKEFVSLLAVFLALLTIFLAFIVLIYFCEQPACFNKVLFLKVLSHLIQGGLGLSYRGTVWGWRTDTVLYHGKWTLGMEPFVDPFFSVYSSYSLSELWGDGFCICALRILWDL